MATNIKKRIECLESVQTKADLAAMTDEQPDAHIRTLEFKSPESYSAIVTKVLRHPSTLPIVRDVPPDTWL